MAPQVRARTGRTTKRPAFFAVVAAVLMAIAATPPVPAAVPTPKIDLQVTKTASAATAVAGGTLSYTIEVTNGGPSGALAVVLEDILPAAVTFSAAASTRGSCSETAGTVTCTIGPMLAGDVVTVTVDVAIAADASGDLVNTATVRNDEPGPGAPEDTDPDNDATSVSTPIPLPPEPARLDVVLFDQDDQGREPGGLVAGDPFTYVFAIVNTGGQAATVDKVEIRLEDQRRLQVSGFGTCRPTRPQVIECPAATVPAGGAATVEIDVVVITGNPMTLEATATAFVAGGAELSDVEPTPVNGGPLQPGPIELRLSMAPPRRSIAIGETATIALRIENVSDFTATGARVAVTVPPGLSLAAGPELWEVPSLPARTGAMVELTLSGDEPGAWLIGGEVVAADQSDAASDPGDGVGSDTARAEVSVTQVLAAALVAPAGLVFADADGDGVADAGEAGHAGVAVRLVDPQGVAVAAALTGADGRYALGPVPAGHRVEVLSAGFVPTTPSARLARSGAVDFGLRAQEMIPATGFAAGEGAAAGLALLAAGVALVALAPRRRSRRRDR